MGGKRVDLFELGQLTFEKPDTDTFQGLALAYQAARMGGSMPTVYNAANEMAVKLFLERRLSFPGITECIGEAMARHRIIEVPAVEEILETEKLTYEYILKKEHIC